MSFIPEEITEVISAAEALALLPEGQPEARQSWKEDRSALTEEEKKMVDVLRSLAYHVACEHQGFYTVEGLRTLLEREGRGKGTTRLYRFVVVHNHRLKDIGRWKRLQPPHRGPHGRKGEVYQLMLSEGRFESVACECAWCTHA